MKQIVIRVMLGLCLGVAPALAFDAYDAKPIAALELMNEEELAYEASQACSGVFVGRIETQLGRIRTQLGRIETQLGHPDPYRVARQYLNTVGLVARKNNNGDTPQWYTDTLEASLGESPEACSRPFARQSQIKHEQERQKLQRYKEEMNRQIEQARTPPPVAVPATEAQLDAEYKAARRQDTVKAYQEFLYRHKAHETHYAEALARLDVLLHPGGEVHTGSPRQTVAPSRAIPPPPISAPLSNKDTSVPMYNDTSSADTQLRNAEREFRAGTMSLEEFRSIKKVLQGK